MREVQRKPHILRRGMSRWRLEKRPRTNRKEMKMTYYAGFEPLGIRDHNEEVLREVSKLRLEKRLREAQEARSGRRFAIPFRRMLPLPR